MLLIILVFGMFCVSSASANPDGQGKFSVSSLFNLILLACSVVGLLWALKVLSLVRGGLMSKSWQMFLLGFIFLGIAQIISLMVDINIVAFPEFVSTLFYMLMAGTWLAGLHQTRKVLG